MDSVRMIGIKGIGGGGKTTLARAVFDHISIQFEGKSFVEDVRERSKGLGLKELQKEVLQDVLNDQNIYANSVYDGERMMKNTIPGRKVLIVLDDVDHIDQLKALAGSPSWFKPGSKIIITTRDEQVLKAHRVNFIHDVSLLSYEEAICLFSRCAFERDIPIQGFEKLSEKVVRYASGLPLTITVLGSFLCGRTVLEWEDALERLKKIPEDETLKRLELSYDGLENDYKEIFLDVACILRGERKDDAVRILESCGFNAIIGLSVLQQKSLITISYSFGYQRLLLHDLVVEMGQNIVHRLHPNEPSRHSRLWIKEEIEDILVNRLGTEATRCINLPFSDLHPTIIMEGLRNMKELRFLSVRGVSFGPYFPSIFHQKKLAKIQMVSSDISTLRERGKRKVFNRLRCLNLRGLKLRTFDLGMTPNLKTLELSYCMDFVELHMPTECPKLELVNLSYSKLRTFDLGMTLNLKTLDLNCCSDFVKLYMPTECPKLELVNLGYSKLRTFDLGMTPNLKTLDLNCCSDFVELHMPTERPKLELVNLRSSKLRTFDLEMTPNLKTLDLNRCSDFVELHMPTECPKLELVNLDYSKLRTFDLGMTPNLKTLDLNCCKDFVELHMPMECPKLVLVNLRFSKLRTFDLGMTPNLKTLDLDCCSDFVELHMPMECPKLVLVNLRRSKLRTFDLGMTPNLKTLHLTYCRDFVELHMPTECPKLEHLELHCLNLKTFDLRMTPNLKTLYLKLYGDFVEFHMLTECPKLEHLDLGGPHIPEAVVNLDRLEPLTMSFIRIKHLPDSICLLKHLKRLTLQNFYCLKQLPKDLDRLECLKELNIRGCMSLQDIPDSIYKIKCLEYLLLGNCRKVEKLPEEIGRLECLKELNIGGAGIKRLPQSIFELKGLRIIGSMEQLLSYGFTSFSTQFRITCNFVGYYVVLP